jgi:hypothetical protein
MTRLNGALWDPLIPTLARMDIRWLCRAGVSGSAAPSDADVNPSFNTWRPEAYAFVLLMTTTGCLLGYGLTAMVQVRVGGCGGGGARSSQAACGVNVVAPQRCRTPPPDPCCTLARPLEPRHSHHLRRNALPAIRPLKRRHATPCAVRLLAAGAAGAAQVRPLRGCVGGERRRACVFGRPARLANAHAAIAPAMSHTSMPVACECGDVPRSASTPPVLHRLRAGAFIWLLPYISCNTGFAFAFMTVSTFCWGEWARCCKRTAAQSSRLLVPDGAGAEPYDNIMDSHTWAVVNHMKVRAPVWPRGALAHSLCLTLATGWMRACACACAEEGRRAARVLAVELPGCVRVWGEGSVACAPGRGTARYEPLQPTSWGTLARMAPALLAPHAAPPHCVHRPHGRPCALTTCTAAALRSLHAPPPRCCHRPHGRRVAFTACMAITVHLNRHARRLLGAGAAAPAPRQPRKPPLCRAVHRQQSLHGHAHPERPTATAIYASRAVRRLPHLVCAGRQCGVPGFGSPCVAGKCGRALGVSESLVPREEVTRPQCTRTVCAHAAWRNAQSALASGACPSSDSAGQRIVRTRLFAPVWPAGQQCGVQTAAHFRRRSCVQRHVHTSCGLPPRTARPTRLTCVQTCYPWQLLVRCTTPQHASFRRRTASAGECGAAPHPRLRKTDRRPPRLRKADCPPT